MFPWFTYAAIIFGMTWIVFVLFARIATWISRDRMILADFLVISGISLMFAIIACAMHWGAMSLGIPPYDKQSEPPAIERIYFEEE